MPATLILEHVPDEIYLRLQAAARKHQRSLNSEAIVCLQAVLAAAPQPAPDHRLERARQLRAGLAPQVFPAHEIDAFKHQGRP